MKRRNCGKNASVDTEAFSARTQMKHRNSLVSKLITIVLGLMLCAYIGYQAYRALYKPVETVSAVYVEVDNFIRVNGCVVRNEKILIKNYDSGVLEAVADEGERVKNGDQVVLVHASEGSAEKKREAEEIEKEIEQMTTLYAQSNENFDIERANQQIVDSAISLVELQHGKSLEELDERIEELKFGTLVREYIYRDKDGLLRVIEELKEERDEASSEIVIKNRIYASDTGYFSRKTDGYESVLNYNELMNMTPADFEKARNQHADSPENAIGKIVSDSKWYFAAVLSEEDIKALKQDSKLLDEEGKTVTLKFDDKKLPDVSAKIIKKAKAENGKVLLVMECATNIADFTKVRDVEADIVVETYSGLRVPQKSLRVNEGNEGVYCLIDSQVKFKRIEKLFEKEGYAIVKYDTSDTKSLLLYDEIVVSGKELTNKKIVK